MLCSLQNLHQNLFTADKKYLNKKSSYNTHSKNRQNFFRKLLKKNMTVYDLDVRVQKRF